MIFPRTHASSPRRTFLSGTAAAAILLGSIGPVSAADTLDDSLNGLAPVSADELSTNRGGFNIGPVNVSIGFTLSTNVSGGALGSGVTVTTNFTVNAPGNLTNLGTTIQAAVHDNLANAGVISDGSGPSLHDTISGAVASSLEATLPAAGAALNSSAAANAASANTTSDVGAIAGPALAAAGGSPADTANSAPISTPDLSTAAGLAAPSVTTGSSGANGNSFTPAAAGANGGLGAAASNLPTTVTPQFTAQVDTVGNSVAFTAGGTNVLLQALNGQLALIQNSENNVEIKNSLSANYVIENYQDIAQLSAMHQQLANLASQLLALQGLGK